MKILYITHTTSMTDGSTKSFINLLESVVRLGVKPIVVCPKKDGLYKYLKEQGIDVYAIQYFLNRYPRVIKKHDYILFAIRLLRILIYKKRAEYKLLHIFKNKNIDLIHTNTSLIDIGFLLSKRIGVKHIWHIREYQDLDFNLTPIISKRNFAKLINNGDSYAISITNDILNNFGIKNKKSSCVIYNGIKNSSEIYFNAFKSDYFLFTGRIEPSKGAIHAVSAYLKLCQQCECGRDVPELWILGRQNNQEYLSEIKTLIQDSKYDDKIKFIGEVDNVDYYMQNALAMIVASRSEGFGRITSEAMFNGCFVIGRNSGGTKEQMDNGLEMTGNEIALRYNTEDELTAHLKAISLTGVADYYPYIKRSQETVKELYSIEASSTEIFDFYTRINNISHK